jgi:hypothetical protein
MCGDNDSCAWSARGQKQIWAVKECPARSRFRMGCLLVWGQGKSGLDLWSIEKIVILAPHHVRESSQIGDNGPIAVLPVQTYHNLAQGKRLSFHISTDRLDRLA